jgi:hypothetical protein
MKTKLRILALALVAGGTMFAAPRFSIGISVGGNARSNYAPPEYSHYVQARGDDDDRRYDNDRDRDRDHDRDRGYLEARKVRSSERYDSRSHSDDFRR